MNKLLLLIIFSSQWLTAQVEWEQLKAFPGDARDDAVAVFHEGKIYAGFGLNAGFAYTNDWWTYDTLSEEWQQLAHAPLAPRQYLRYFVVGDSLYLYGGTNGTDSSAAFGDFWLYSFDENRWEQLKNPPIGARWAGAAFSSHGHGYLGLGTNGQQNFNDFWQFDPRKRKWLRLSDFPGMGRAKCVSLAGETKAMVAGGLSENDSGFALHNDIWIFNYLSQSWSLAAERLNEPSAYHYAAADSRYFYVLAGYGRRAQQDTTYSLAQIFSGNGLKVKTVPALDIPFRRGGNMLPISDGQFFLLWGLDSNLVRLKEFYKISFSPAATKREVNVYPNPSVGGKSWLQAEGAVRVKLFDMAGACIYSLALRLSEKTHLLNFEKQRTGIYLLQVLFANGSQQVMKLYIH